MCDRTIKSKHILTKLCALNSEYIFVKAGLILRKILDCTGGDIYGGLGQSPSRVRGKAPLKLTAF